MSGPVQHLQSPYPPFQAWIEVDGKKVNHYKPTGDGNVYSAFIESIPGQPWALCYKPLMVSPKYDFTVEGWVDGGRFEFKSWEGAYAALKTESDATSRVRKFATTKVSKTEERALVFNKVEHGVSAFSDGDQKPRAIGKIQLKISLGKLSKDIADGPKAYDKSFLNQDKVEEGTVDKSISERVALGATQAAKPRTYQTFKPNNSSGGPDVSFEFIYRNRAVLERDGLIVESTEAKPNTTSTESTAGSSDRPVALATLAPALDATPVSGEKPVATLAPKVKITLSNDPIHSTDPPASETAGPEESVLASIGEGAVKPEAEQTTPAHGDKPVATGGTEGNIEPITLVVEEVTVEPPVGSSNEAGINGSGLNVTLERVASTAEVDAPAAKDVPDVGAGEVKINPPPELASQAEANTLTDPPKPPAFASSPLKNEVVLSEESETQVKVAGGPVKVELETGNVDEVIETEDKKEPTPGAVGAATTANVHEMSAAPADDEMSQISGSQVEVKRISDVIIAEPIASLAEDVKMDDTEPAPASQAPASVDVGSGLTADQARTKRVLEERAEAVLESKRVKVDGVDGGDGPAVVEAINGNESAEAMAEDEGLEVRVSVVGNKILTDKVVKNGAGNGPVTE